MQYLVQRCAERIQEAGQGEGGHVQGPEQAARVHDRVARQDDHGDTDPGAGEHQSQKEWGQHGRQQVWFSVVVD